MTTAQKYPVKEFSPIAAQIAVWAENYGSLVVSDNKSYEGAKAARQEVRKGRTTIESLRKDAVCARTGEWCPGI